MPVEFPALERARRRFLQRTRGEIPDANALDEAKNMLQQLCEAFDKDLQGRYAQPLDTIDSMEKEYSQLLQLLDKPLVDDVTVTTIHAPIERIHHKAINTVPPLSATKATQTLSIDHFAHRLQKAFRYYLVHTLYPRGEAQWQQCRAFRTQCRLDKFPLRLLLATWKSFTAKRMQWHTRALAGVRTPTRDEEFVWRRQVKEADGAFGLAKAYHTRKTLQVVFHAWIELMNS